MAAKRYVLANIAPGVTNVIIEVDTESATAVTGLNENPPRRFRITGKVIDSATELGIPKLRVEAWDKDLIFHDWLGQSEETDAEGRYLIEFDESRFQDLFPEQYPDLFFKLYREGELISANTEPLLRDIGKPREGQPEQSGIILFEVNILMGASTEETTGLSSVKGCVRWADWAPAAGITVHAFDKTLREETRLGQWVSNITGLYEIHYRPLRTDKDGKKTANLIIRAFDTEGRELAASPIRYNAQLQETIDLTFATTEKPSSEYEKLVLALTPSLHGLPLYEVREGEADGELSLLAGETGWDEKRIGWLVRAAKSAREIAAQAASDGLNAEVLTEAFYAWFSQKLPTALAELWLRQPGELMAALDTALAENRVPATLRSYLNALSRLANHLRLDEILKPAKEGASAGLGDFLGGMPEPLQLDREKKRKAAGIITTVSHNDPKFDKDLLEAGLSPRQVVAVRRSLLLGKMSLRQAAMAKALQHMTAGDEDASLQSLAALRPDEWIDLAYTHGTPADAGMDPAAYARHLRLKIEHLHPSEVLKTLFKAKRMRIERPGFEEVGAFMEDNPAFDIVNTRLRNVDGIADRTQLHSALLKLQRVKKLTATWDESVHLINNGIDSAQAVLNLGPDRMISTLTGSIKPDRIKQLYKKAHKVFDMSMGVISSYSPRFSPPPIPVLPDLRKNIDTSLLAEYPTLQKLFGPQDYCECRHCQSVLSPSAYLVDLLEFLKGNSEMPKKAYEALLRRRPDLIDLELSCANTETELPYIDLTLEILENAVALPYPIEIPPGSISDSNPPGNIALSDLQDALDNPVTPPQTLCQAIANAMRATSLEVGKILPSSYSVDSNAILYKDSVNGRCWNIRDEHRLWKVRYEAELFYLGQENFLRKEKMQISDLLGPTYDYPGQNSQKIQETIRNFNQRNNENSIFNNQDNNHGPFQWMKKLSYFHAFYHPLTTLTEGSRWKLDYSLKTIVVITENSELSLIHEYDYNQVTVSTSRYSAETLQSERKSLNSGVLGPVLENILPPYCYEIKQWVENEYTLSTTDSLIISYVAESLSIDSIAYQSSSTGRDLKASPENYNPVAYEICKGENAVFPWTLPFDRPLLEVRAILERMKTSRQRLMELLPNLCDSETRAREALGLSQEEAELITTPATGERLWQLWGLKLDNDGNTRVYDVANGEYVFGKPLEVLANVSILMQQARLTFQELQDVLQTTFGGGCLHLDGYLSTFFPEKSAFVCTPSKIILQNLDERRLDRIHCFVRLWRKLSWHVWEVDIVLLLGGRKYPAWFSDIQAMRTMLGLSVDELVSTWAWPTNNPLIYRAHTQTGQPVLAPLYDRIFLNPLVQNPVDPDFELTVDHSEVRNQNISLKSKASYIGSALGCREQDILALSEKLIDEVGKNDSLKLDNLHYYYWTTKITAKLGLEIKDYWGLFSLGVELWGYTSSEQWYWSKSLQFAKLVDFIGNSGFTVEELLYLFKHEAQSGSTVELTEKEAETVLTELLALLQAKRQELDSNEDFISFRAEDIADVDLLIAKLASDPNQSTKPVSDFVWGEFGEVVQESLTNTTSSKSGKETKLLSALNDILKGEPIYDDLTSFPLDILRPVTVSLLMLVYQNPTYNPRLLLHLNRLLLEDAYPKEIGRNKAQHLIQLEEIAIAHLAERFGLDSTLANRLLSDCLQHPTTPARKAIDAIVDSVFLEGHPKIQSGNALFSDAFNVIYKLHKVSLICAKLKIKASHLDWLPDGSDASKSMSVLNFNKLPVMPVKKDSLDPALLFAAWQELVKLIRIRDRMPGAEAMLANYVAAEKAGPLAADKVLAESLGLPDEDVRQAGNAADARKQLLCPSKLEQWLDLLVEMKSLGASFEQIKALVQPSVNADAAAIARNLLRSKYGNDHQSELLKPIADTLRSKQRDALVDYLITREGLRDANDLYEYYLIDVQMSPCMMTTRTLQAISAVQLFIQRCLLNLEKNSGVTPDQIDRQRWEWMKNYRVWEANRKIFLYPENWLYPELRDDKTQTFRALESGIAQDQPSYELAKEKLLDYLDEWADLAKLNVIGMYEDKEEKKEDEDKAKDRILYIVARTNDEPSQYYWRTCTNLGDLSMRWSGWERIDLDLSGDHVMPFVMEGSFHLAWPIIKKTRNDAGTKEQWEVQLAYARKSGKGWSKKKISKETMKVDAPYNISTNRGIILRMEIKERDIRFHLYGVKDSGEYIRPPNEDNETVTRDAYIAGPMLVSISVYNRINMGQSHIYMRPKANFVIHKKITLDWYNPAAIQGKKYNEIPLSAELVQNRIAPRLGEYSCGILYGTILEDTEIDGKTVSLDFINKVTVCVWDDSNNKVCKIFEAGDSPIYSRFYSKNEYDQNILEKRYYKKGVEYCHWEIYLDVDDQKMLSPERPLDITRIGYFAISPFDDMTLIEYNGVSYLDGEVLRDSDKSPITICYGNGYLEYTYPSPNSLNWVYKDLMLSVCCPGNGVNSKMNFEYSRVFGSDQSPSRFQLIPAVSIDIMKGIAINSGLYPGPQTAWHYQDGLSRLYIKMNNTLSGEVITDREWTAVMDQNTSAANLRISGHTAFEGDGGLYSLDSQNQTDIGNFNKYETENLNPSTSLTADKVNFELRAPSAIYNWEIFFHAPLLIAEALTREQRFEEAQRWLHYVFDPTTNNPGSEATRFWRFLRFRELGRPDSIQRLLEMLSNPKDKFDPDPEKQRIIAEIKAQIEAWLQSPFRPHAIARFRQSAYQWRVLFAYLDNLIAWADQLFRRDTRESVQEATLLYVLAAKILGPRPRSLPRRVQLPSLTYQELSDSKLDKFGNAWVILSDELSPNNQESE